MNLLLRFKEASASDLKMALGNAIVWMIILLQSLGTGTVCVNIGSYLA